MSKQKEPSLTKQNLKLINRLAATTGINVADFSEAVQVPRELYLEQITSAEKALRIWQTARPGSYRQDFAFKKWVDFSKTVADVLTAYKATTDSDLRLYALQRMIEIEKIRQH